MATIRVFQESLNSFYTVTVDIFSSVVDKVNGSPSNAETDYYLKISTTMKYHDGTSFPEYMIRSLDDVPTGYLPATTFSELVDNYVEYFITMAELTMSSSSSTSSSKSSSSSSSSSSSMGYSQSSLSSGSSSSESSSSSSSSFGYSISSDSSDSSSTEWMSSSSDSSDSSSTEWMSSSSSSSTEWMSSSSSSSTLP